MNPTIHRLSELSLHCYKSNEGVETQKITHSGEISSIEKYTEHYIESHWKEIIMPASSRDSYYKSKQYKLDRGIDLAKKYQ